MGPNTITIYGPPTSNNTLPKLIIERPLTVEDVLQQAKDYFRNVLQKLRLFIEVQTKYETKRIVVSQDMWELNGVVRAADRFFVGDGSGDLVSDNGNYSSAVQSDQNGNVGSD